MAMLLDASCSRQKEYTEVDRNIGPRHISRNSGSQILGMHGEERQGNVLAGLRYMQHRLLLI
jgi:hypothetical protein